MFGLTTRSDTTRTIVALFRNSHYASRAVHQINLTSIQFGSELEQWHRPPVVHVDDRARCRITTVDDPLGAECLRMSDAPRRQDVTKIAADCLGQCARRRGCEGREGPGALVRRTGPSWAHDPELRGANG